MAKESVEKRYEKHGRIKPCVLTRDDILALAGDYPGNLHEAGS